MQKLVIIDNLLVFIGFYILFPILTVHFVNQLGMSATVVAVGLGLRTGIQQSLTVFAGALADRLGAKPFITSGLALRAVSFLCFAHATSVWSLWFACLIAGLGGALFDSPKGAVIVKLTRANERTKFYALMGTLSTVGTAGGAALGGWLLVVNFQWVCYAGAAAFLLASLLTAFFLPPFRVGVKQAHLLSGLQKVWQDKWFVRFSLLGSGYWFLWLQMMSTMPLLVIRITGQQTAVSWMYTVETILTLSLQYPIAKWSIGRWASDARLQTGMGLMIAGLLMLSVTSSAYLLWPALVVFTLGIVIGDPALQESIAHHTDPKMRGAYLGFNAISMAISGSVGYVLSGWLYQQSIEWQRPALSWIIISLIGGICLYYLYLLCRQPKTDKPVRAIAQPQP
ncbi:MFS transporter [Leeia sp. TBRC 13508]|uniref:MFS transporter n=1 Tax=Leeia speluncae TaxID=2884804 RepID=A0ABS8D1J3_9NEIS|nr:MFS transporter [Leeia speluncae]MCB6182069.1 MFS transporter [Leeia speluncae]